MKRDTKAQTFAPGSNAAEIARRRLHRLSGVQPHWYILGGVALLILVQALPPSSNRAIWLLHTKGALIGMASIGVGLFMALRKREDREPGV